MASAKTSSSTANGTAKGKKEPPTNGAVSSVEKRDTLDVSSHAPSTGKPDKKAYEADQGRIKGEIGALQANLSALRDKISLTTKGGTGNERRNHLRTELDDIRSQQSSNKASRRKILDQLKAYQDNVQKKIKDLQAAQSKILFKNVGEVDARIKTLEKQVESGNMKLADEKRAVHEISTCKCNRRTVESFQATQESIEADRHSIDELRKQLDNPEFKATSDRFESIKAELDELKREEDEAYVGRAKLFEERDGLQAQLSALFDEKRDSAQRFREANNRYWAKVNEDRARRAERAQAQRAAEEAERRREAVQRLRDEAEIPAYQSQIEDCQTLIAYLSGKNTGPSKLNGVPSDPKAQVAGVAKLELRKVEAAPEGAVVRKKKGEEASYFVAKGKGKGRKSAPKPVSTPEPTPGGFNIDFSRFSALLSLSISPPDSAADVPRVISDLQTKKAWFEANQSRVTAENLAKAEAEINRLSTKEVAATPEITPSAGEYPGEPASTAPSSVVPDDVAEATVDAVHEEVKEADS
ncbi:uncharacterized protein BT62DRAFT_668294 [Guyanagaster necrorhizus]|uniref:Nuclear segregation protein Bfr1 n=1 Tax=Guyanagaster necrorhizus TaxID=856835 RepID=A0A9P7VYQ4_9AGAR|nr:uncharacterized protein BT62DRAFT_668294 [Guyanagaster necrorhizus MCA 3950]KAG7449185.1 hypothetical protein BT62DRAFT_668294 [Guyanagaster necrorhizus MCA 3950]